MTQKTVPQELGKGPLDAAVRALYEVSWGEARKRIERGKITVDGETWTEPTKRVSPGALLVFTENAKKPRPATDLPDDAIVFVDAHVVVVDKPAGISTIPFDASETGTLDERVRAALSRMDKKGSRRDRPVLGVVHRIDKETSGLVVFTRSWLAKQSLAGQFREHTVHRRYLAIAHGVVKSRTIRSRIVQDRGDGLRGSRPKNDEGQEAITHIEALEPLQGATLIACKLETGRTHQIRVHLSEAGHPLVGERVYSRHFKGDQIPAPRMMLHAAELGFVHPATEADVMWKRDPPKDFAQVLARLRAR